MAWTVTVTATTITSSVDLDSVRIENSGESDVATATFDVTDKAGTITAIVPEAEVTIARDGTTVFAGIIKSRTRSHAAGDPKKRYTVNCVDYTALLADNVVDQEADRTTDESDKARITWLLSTWGTKGVTVGAEVVQQVAHMPAQNFFGMTLYGAVEAVGKLASGGRFYVGFDKKLHYFSLTESSAAPYGYSDTPNNSTTYGYSSLTLPDDATGLVNAVLVIGTDISGWRTDAASIATYGRHEGTIRDADITTTAHLNGAGDAYLAANANPHRAATLVTTKGDGVRAGMDVQVTNARYGLAATSYRVTRVSLTPLSPTQAEYTLTLGDSPISLASLVSSATSYASQAVKTALDTTNTVSALDAGGANLVVNSSFENASTTGWSVGGSWTFGFAVGDAYQGAKTARLVLAAATAGDLLTPVIPVNRLLDYHVSAWSFLRSRASGTARIFVREYDSGHNLLAETVLTNLTAAETVWTRFSAHLGPGGANFNASTTEIRLGANSAAGAATLTWDLDALQIEQGFLLTGWGPTPQELVDDQVTATQIHDDAITTNKIAANQVTAGKIASHTITAAEIAAGTLTATEIAASAITSDKIAVGGWGMNLLRNGSFEDASAYDAWQGVGVSPIYGWACNAGTYLQCATSGYSRTGTRIAEFKDPTGGVADTGIAQVVPVRPGRRYRLSVWFAKGVTGGSHIHGQLRAHAVKNGAIVTSDVINVDCGYSATMAQFGGEYTIPDDGTVNQLSIELRSASAPDSTDLFDWDDAQIVESSSTLINGPGEVIIDNTGIAITNGKIVVRNPGSTVIIDGTSDMFKIAASGTMSSTQAANTSGSATVTLTSLGALSSTPAFIAHVATTTSASGYRYSSNSNWSVFDTRQFVAASSGGPANIPVFAIAGSVEASTNLDGSSRCVFTLWHYNFTGSSNTEYLRYYVLQETAV